MKLSRTLPGTRGFTLLEVLMASVIMLVGIVGAATVLISGSRMLESSRQQAVASQIIRSEMERLRLQDWAQLTNGSLPVDLSTRYPAGTYPAYQALLQRAQFQCTRVIADVDPVNRPNYKQVTFTVTWTDHNRLPHTRQSSTYVGKNGLYVSYQR